MKIIDMHCDTVMSHYYNREENLLDREGHLNLQMMQKAGALAQFFAIYLMRPEIEENGPYSLFEEMYQLYLKQMEQNSDLIRPAYCCEDILKNQADGKMSSILTIEDGVFVEDHIERIREVYDKGVRLITLLWNFENSLGYPSSDNRQAHNLGLKPMGIEAVELMNQLGMIVDVSHLSEGGFYDVAQHSKAPFVASHSCARALCNHRRNLTDHQLQTLGNKGGLAGVNFAPFFLKEDSEYSEIDQVIRHLRYMADKAGIESVGLGSDFDGIDDAGEIENYEGYIKILERMQGVFTDDEIDKICSGNALRVMKDVFGK